MDPLNHRLKVFVFTERGGEIQYLLLRHTPRHDTFWGPVEGPILPAENLELAVCRRVRDEVGLERPSAIVDLKMPERWMLPDEEIVEWIYGYGADPAVELKHVRRDVTDLRWEGFDHAYRALELPANREAILRLHLTLMQ